MRRFMGSIRKYSVFLDFKMILMTPKIMFLKESTEGVKEGEEDGEKSEFRLF